MSEKLSSSIGMNTEDFKTGVAQLNRELRVVKSEFAATASTFTDWTKDIDGLEARTKSLNSQIEIQGQKVSATRAQYERMVEAHGADSRAAQDAEVKYNNETATLNKMNTELTETEKAMDEVKNSSEDAGKGVKKMGDEGKTLKAVLTGVTSTVKLTAAAMLAMIGVMLAVVTAIGGLVFASATAADELATLSAQTGISTEKLQELKFAGDQIGVSLDTITGSQAKLIKSMVAAREQSEKFADALASGKEEDEIAEIGNMAKAFNSLGVKVTDASGNLRDSEVVFGEAIDALGRIKDPTERDAAAMAIFGKSAQELNPLINTGSAGLKDYAKQAHEMGAVVDGETIDALGNFSDTIDGIKGGLQGIATTIAGVFLPGFAEIAGKVQGYVGQLAGVVNGSQGVGALADGISKLFVTIAQDIAKNAPQMLQAGVDVLKGITSAILSALPNLVPAATNILTNLVQFLGEALPLMIDAGIGIVLALVNTILPALPMLVDVALKAIITLANGLTEALPTLLPTVATVIVGIVNALVANLPAILLAAIQLITALAQGLTAAIPILLPAIPIIITALVDGLLDNQPALLIAAGQLIGALAVGIVTAIPYVFSALVKLTQTIVGTLFSQKVNLVSIGIYLIDGLWEGIKAGWATLLAGFSELVSLLPQAIKDILGIHSPSKVGIELGTYFSQGFGMGLLDEMDRVKNEMQKSLGGFSTQMAAGAGPSISNNSQDNSFKMQAQTIIFQGPQTPGTVAATARQKSRRY